MKEGKEEEEEGEGGRREGKRGREDGENTGKNVCFATLKI